MVVITARWLAIVIWQCENWDHAYAGQAYTVGLIAQATIDLCTHFIKRRTIHRVQVKSVA